MSYDGWILPEQTIEDVLQSGLDLVTSAIQADDGSLERLISLAFVNLSTAKQSSLMSWLRTHDLRIIEGYPRENVELPCWAVILQPESQVQFIGDAVAEKIYMDATVVEGGEQWQSVVGVFTFAENAELAKWLYHLSKFFLARARKSLVETFEVNVSMAGQNLGFEPRFLQAGRFVYSRAVSVTCVYVQRGADEYDLTDEFTSENVGTEVDVESTQTDREALYADIVS